MNRCSRSSSPKRCSRNSAATRWARSSPGSTVGKRRCSIANVFLCGLSGCGKSTVAPILARMRGLEALDLDRAIVADAGLSIAEIFAREGEAGFRKREAQALADACAKTGRVVALGGGALDDARSRERIAQSGALVFLDAPLDVLEARLTSGNGDVRPLLSQPGALAALRERRLPYYSAAALTIDTADRAPEEVAREIDLALRVHVGSGLIGHVADLASLEPKTKVAIVGDRRLGKHLNRLKRDFERAGALATLLPVRADERLKSLDALTPLYGKLLEAQLDRRSIVVGAGGGTIGDAIGFLAATYLRGVRFISIPTTLVADIDSSIGGKTGVNHPLGKNLIGVVAQPSFVVIDPALLATLDRRDRISGLGEIVKTGLIADAALYEDLTTNWRALMKLKEPFTTDVIARCVAFKIKIVAGDETDRSGLREQLNFGHTVGHALERVLGYGKLRHGEAVIVGMRAAVALSARRGLLPEETARAVDTYLATLPVPSFWKKIRAQKIVDAAQHDKKRTAQGLRFVLLDRIGHTVPADAVTAKELLPVLRSVGFR
ncbi:MAG: 3-dehydroquinate synthase [Candidatus Eremiobacteraeota bacterium]|nr:3-dehydroquinate synthase [Candidatus Eremiobacteraeota bacterium]